MITPRPTLDELAIANETDKATVFTRTYAKPKGFTVHYERFFEPLRDKPITILEIGVGGGESICTWLSYFTQAKIYGLDNVQNTNQWNTPGAWDQTGKYRFVHGDQGSPTTWACFLADHPGPFDVIIDDGSHQPKDIIVAYECLWPVLVDGGLYCVEDLGCGFTSPGFPTHEEFFRTMVSTLHTGGGRLDSIYFARELAIVRKRLCTTS